MMRRDQSEVPMSKRKVILVIGGIAVLVGAGVGGVAALLSRSNVPSADAAGAPFRASTASTPTKPPPIAYAPRPVGDDVQGHPIIAHVAIVDLDADGLADILACDGLTNSIRWLRQFPRGVFLESQIGESVPGPVHVSPCDIDRDGDLDLLVASMGVILPNNDRIGSVVVLENLGDARFQHRVVLENTTRVTDVRGADLNHDGRVDLVVGQFGYVQGGIQWMENLGNWQFRSHPLLDEPGAIHTPVADFDRDGRPDFAALISQDAEAVRVYRSLGGGELSGTVIWRSPNRGWGSSGLDVGDVNRDGWPDLIYTNGDGFEAQGSLPSWQGLQWLENVRGVFTYHRIGDFAGCYSPACADLDGDGDEDIVAVSTFNNWQDPAAVSLMAWLNDGAQKFTPVVLAHTPTHLVTVAVGDLDGDGIPELVTGGFHVYPPWTNLSRITWWKRH